MNILKVFFPIDIISGINVKLYRCLGNFRKEGDDKIWKKKNEEWERFQEESDVP